MKIIDVNEFNSEKKKVCSVRLSPAEYEAIDLLRRYRWIRDRTNLTWGAALREVISAYPWETVG